MSDWNSNINQYISNKSDVIASFSTFYRCIINR